MEKNKKRKTIKNIDPIILDIKKPNFNYKHLLKFETINLKKIPSKSEIKTKKNIRIKTFLFATFILILIIFSIGLNNFQKIKNNVTISKQLIVSNLLSSANALKKLNENEAKTHLEENLKNISSFNKILENEILKNTLNSLGYIIPFIKTNTQFIKDVENLNLNLFLLSQIISDLKENGFNYFQKDGKLLIQKLENTKTIISDIISQIKSLQNKKAELKNFTFFKINDNEIEDQYLKYSAELYKIEKILDELIVFLKSEKPRHLAILFQNPSEIRPGGGFIGSYGQLTILEGKMQSLEVRDIYDPDGQLAIKIIPPKELQTITTNWGARDANWFFDFPTSAKTVLNFLNASKMYSEKNVIFEGAIGINVNLINSILEITGPIKIEGYPEINAKNFLIEVEAEKQKEKQKKSPYPKKILQILTPVLIEKLNNLNEKQKEELVNAIKYHLDKKDIMIYFKNTSLQNILDELNVSGKIYELPYDFWGNYLAVVNANIAGGKSDFFVTEDVSVNVDIDVLGNIFTSLTITRTHNGNQMKESWWREDNKDFIQIFTEPNSNLVDVTGNDTIKKYSILNYANLDYAINPDLYDIEKNDLNIPGKNIVQRKQFGKNVFGTWLITKRGQSKILKIKYQTQYPNIRFVYPNQKYTFVFEKQSGVKNSLNIKINAPFRYFWQETNSSVFTFSTDDPQKRIIINLTLKNDESR